jgi:type I restriction enzyme R subunit
MSKLLGEIIDDLRAKRIDYAEYLKRIAELARKVQTGLADSTPAELSTPGIRAIFNNLRMPGHSGPALATLDPPAPYGTDAAPRLKLAVSVDEAVRRVRPDDWRGHTPKENVIKSALLPLFNGDMKEVEQIFPIIKAQKEY